MAEGTEKPRGESVTRRDILQVSTAAAAVAGAAGLMTGTASAQQIAQNAANSANSAAPRGMTASQNIRTGEPNPIYDYSAITKRPKLKWPNGARVAVFIVPNVEHWDMHDDKGLMDVRNNPRNDYGLRVAIWRLFDIFAARKIQTTIALNASAGEPVVLAAARRYCLASSNCPLRRAMRPRTRLAR